MADKNFPQSQIPIRKTSELLPQIFQTEANQKFLAATLDPLVQPGVLEKKVGYVGKRYGKTYKSQDVYLDSDETLRSRYQLEPGVVVNQNEKITNFYDYLDFKNQLKFFGNLGDRDDLTVFQDHYTWNPPIAWDKLVNYREYYWVPEGPPAIKILGQAQNITSTYRVTVGVGSVFIFTPDGLTNNPALTLYRGQTYKFQISTAGNPFVIRTNIDTGSLTYNPGFSYAKGQLTVFNGKIWKAKNIINPADGSSIDENSADWEFVDISNDTTAFDYLPGLTNNGTENGTITFTVPLDAPDVLFYQSYTDPNKFGRFIISNVEDNTKIDIEKEIIGKSTYTSSNGISFSTGMVVYFSGKVFPEKYSNQSMNNKWIVEGVGDRISLVNIADLVISTTFSNTSPEVLFDNSGFDSQPFDDATAFPNDKDYITINRSSLDSNPWSRYNRWFHRSVLDYAHSLNDSSFEATETTRAKRPIIEFNTNLKLYNHGTIAQPAVDYVDDFTTDIFSVIEGSAGYIIDGENLFDGARILVTNDRDILANNQIYIVKFITHINTKQISLIRSSELDTVIGECVLVRRGVKNKGFMFHFDGTSWIRSQVKTSVNQQPLFDMFDSNEVSFGNQETYSVSSFVGTPILSYKLGIGAIDKELGFSISYLNIDNVGDIQFNFNLDSDTFAYKVGQNTIEKNLATGFYKFNGIEQFENGWIKLNPEFTQPIIDTVLVLETTNKITTTTVDWAALDDSKITKIIFYVNGVHLRSNYVRTNGTFVFTNNFNTGDTVTIKLFANIAPNDGYYEIPLGLEKNPLNEKIKTFTLGQASDHVSTGLEISDDFIGKYPGNNNLRDISGYQNLTRRFLKHSSPAPLSIMLLCDKETNIIKSIQYAKKAYTDFKNSFITLANELYYNQSPNDFIDSILEEISKSQNSSRPFAGSDMIGSGAYSSIDYVVEDTGIKTFALSEKFDLLKLSSKAVYVYYNNIQLLVNRDYEFNATFGFVNLKINLIEGDRIQIREYVSTAINFIPPTPTKLGLYKKYTPRKFLDNTYLVPKEVIQGHDGSITIAYGDFRDNVLLELEYRIYNNIKQEYNEKTFDIDSVLGGYYGNTPFGKTEVDNIVNAEFLKWISGTSIDYVNNSYFDTEEAFTYTYSNMADPTGTKNLPGYWRGIYQWFYDTTRPHQCPWEMLGFSEKPIWWDSEYGPAPYTSNNLILWEDVRDGIIRQGDRAGTRDRYKRPSILQHIPVDGDGNLLSPLASGLARNFSLINNRGDFVLGDIGPVEYAWRASSEWPFAVATALCLLKPIEFIADGFNRSTVSTNKLGQSIHSTTELFLTIDDLLYESTLASPVSGLVIYIINYLKSTASDISVLRDKLSNVDVKLSSRLSGFVDQAQQKYILDSKNPKSATSSIFIPPENYDIHFNVSSPISNLAYSGVILEKTNRGYKVSGYDNSTPLFYYYGAVISQTDPLITVGGVSDNFLDWTGDKFYGNGIIARFKNNYYRSLKSHTSDFEFSETQNNVVIWKQLPRLPMIGGTEARKRRNFNKLQVKKLSYGTVLPTIQQVVDFLLGYEEYLKNVGFVFDFYDAANSTARDWFTSAKEFMFWSQHNWADGSLLTLSPAASFIKLKFSVGVADNILDSFYDYQVLKNNGTPLLPRYINVNRDFQEISITTVDTNDGIYFLKLHFVLKEHIAVFDDRTVFNDVIYDKPTGYRQERIKSRGFRTVDWDGDYTSPGFLFDNVNIQTWQPFTDYKLGDIVAYKSYYWTSKYNQLGSEEFQDAGWTKLDSTPSKALIPNFDYRINQFEDYYEVNTDGVGSSQRDLARHAIGYQPREYLQNLAEDEITQFRIYQGFIREKGTANAIVKVFDKISRTQDDSVVLNEEWAFKLAQYGGTDQIKEFEFEIKKDQFEINPQPILITYSETSGVSLDQYLRINSSKFTIADTPFTTTLNPVVDYIGNSRSAGFVNKKHVDVILKNRDDILNLNIREIFDNSHLWITFDNSSWTVLRYNEELALRIARVEKISETEIEVELNRIHNLEVGDIVGIRYVLNLNGFFKITAVTNKTIIVTPRSTDVPEIEDSTSSVLGIFTVVRFPTYQQIDSQKASMLKLGSKLWVDNTGTDKWEVIEKTKQYTTYEFGDYGITAPLGTGTSVAYLDNLKQVATGIPGSGYVMIYTAQTAGTQLTLKQIVAPPDGFETAVAGSFGKVLAVSPDNKWLAVGSPNASGVKSAYQGELYQYRSYLAGEIVLYQGKLWEAVNNIDLGDGSSINFNSEDWKPATIVNANPAARGNGFTDQGMISLYKYVQGQWEIANSFVSPRQAEFEEFGSAISIGVSGITYYMAVSAVGSLCDPAIGPNTGKGRVYLYIYNGTEWTHLENTKYLGVYRPSALSFYPAGSIVWSEGSLWEALYDNYGDGSSLSLLSNDWKKLDPVSTQSSLPTNIAMDDDGSTLSEGLLSPTQLAELVKEGDQFGISLTMTRDGGILVIGAPNSDGQYFANYRGDWNVYQEYREDDVVKWQGGYHRLTDSTTSSITSLGQYPDNGLPWLNVGDSASPSTGKIFIYEKDSNNLYSLTQTITAESLSNINDTANSGIIASGDQFGFAIDIDASGTTIVASSPLADINKQNQGAAYVFRRDSAAQQFRLKQKLQSFEYFTNEYFGSSLSITPSTEKIVISAKNSGYFITTQFALGTTFDKRRTTFTDPRGFPGQVYVYERKDEGYFLVEKLEADFQTGESFGYSIDATSSFIVVGSPTYQLNNVSAGRIRLFRKSLDTNSFNTIAQQTDLIDIDLLKNVELYDNVNNKKIADLDIIDGFKLKILGTAEQEISFKTVYDPAIYITATEDQVIDETQAWFEKNVGQIWWDLSAVKYLNYEQDDFSYRIGNWNSQAVGSSIDIYEWVSSPLLPSEWSILADTVEGLVEGISGQPKFADDTVFNTKVFYNPNTGLETGTIYYYWVKSKATLPETAGRKVSAASIKTAIDNPIGSGIPFIAVIGVDKFLAYNLPAAISTNTALINFEYVKNLNQLNPIHREYQLLTSGVSDSLPSVYLEKKWIDSLVGSDGAGNTIPDPKLPAKKKYGLSFRPRQSMFINRDKALKIAIDNINTILSTRPFTDLINFENLNKLDPIPSEELNQYDVKVDTNIDLEQVGTVKIRQAVFTANIINGEIDTIDITDPGFGYRTVPYIEIEGDGFGAKAIITLNAQGKINSIKLTSKGRKYTTAVVKIRPFSVLVNSDITALGFWSIYAWDQQRRIFYRSKSQGYDTTIYWELVDWWSEGYSQSSRIIKEIVNIYQEPSIEAQVGDLIRIKEYSSGGWAILEKTEQGLGNLLDNYNLVGRQFGTIKIKDILYNRIVNSLGYDNVGSYDAALYDLQPTKELRIILQAAKENIFVDDLKVEWNKLFFSSVKYAFSEQTYIDWAFKTSFLNAIHNVGPLEQRPNYKNDNLESFQKYIEEVKPYRTSIREYTSRYTNFNTAPTPTTDFDLPPAYSARDGKVLPINQYYNRFDEYPWKWWADNNGYSIVSIAVANSGADYTSPPSVLIQGTGTGVVAQAYISNGKVSNIRIVSPGTGYIGIPTVRLVGGNGASINTAKAVAILGDSKVRSFDLTMKFDRTNKNGTYQSMLQNQTFIATGFSSIFDLKYAPTRDKNKITVIKNNQTVLNTAYALNLYTSTTDTYSLIKGKIKFYIPPLKGDTITVTYEKNDKLLDSVDRIRKYYAPSVGMKGTDLNQLMTGIDFGGVQVQGTTFDVTGGWDALPWFTDSWDSVESSNDFYYVADGSTTFVSLPYTPENNQPISIYIQRSGTNRPIRIDDPAYTSNWDSSSATNRNAEMPTFIGDGSTKIIEIHRYLSTQSGDTLIFRKLDSDGSVVISDVNLLDTRISGGTLANIGGAYVTASGMTPEEIIIDGEKFVSPDHVPAPEENVPGQILDSVSIKVFNKTNPGAAPLQHKGFIGDGTTRRFDIGLTVVESKAIMVYVNKIKQEYIGDSTINYTIDFIENKIEFNVAPLVGSVIEIISVGIGGIGILDYQEFVADGETNLFLTNAIYQQTSTVLVTLDGVEIDTGFANSSDFINVENKTIVQFGLIPAYRQVIKIVCFESSEYSNSNNLSFVRVNQQTTTFDGSTRTIPVDQFVNLQRSSAIASILINVNGRYLQGVDTTYLVYNGTNNNITVGIDPAETIGTITSGGIKVYINEVLQQFVIDFTYNGNQNLINVSTDRLTVGDIIRVETNVRAQYSVVDNNIIIAADVDLNTNDDIQIIWFSEYPTMNMTSDEYTGGKLQYQLPRQPLDENYVWVYKNGQRLTKDADYSLSLARSVIYLTENTVDTDLIKIVQFSSVIYAKTRAFEIFKDMLNNYHFKRHSRNNNVRLSKELKYYDTELEVTDATALSEPIPSRRIPGVVIINNERIDYFEKNGNVLSQLRRGCFGTGIATVHPLGSFVINAGATETVPYTENQKKSNFVSDGSTILIGPLDFTPRQSIRSNWYRNSIPTEYGPCDEIEIFISGKRLRKNPIDVYVESNGASSPLADELLEAEFSVNGTSPYIRLTTPIDAGAKITIIRKLGRIWYERSDLAASKGITLLSNNTPIAEFIAAKTSELPE
jgi:Fe-S cluster assembly iron-binding protein IscA